MSNRRIKTAIAREDRAATRAGQSVLRRARELNEIKVKARKTATRIKIVLGGDGLRFFQGRISKEEFFGRLESAGHEFRMVNEALANIGLRIGDGQTSASSEESATVAPASREASPKPKNKIVRFWTAPPEEFRRRLRHELGLNWDPESIHWYGDVDPAKVESFIRAHGHWGLVRVFNRTVSSP